MICACSRFVQLHERQVSKTVNGPLWTELLRDIDHADKAGVELFREGAPLMGEMTPCGLGHTIKYEASLPAAAAADDEPSLPDSSVRIVVVARYLLSLRVPAAQVAVGSKQKTV